MVCANCSGGWHLHATPSLELVPHARLCEWVLEVVVDFGSLLWRRGCCLTRCGGSG